MHFSYQLFFAFVLTPLLYACADKFGSDSRLHLELLRNLQLRDGASLLFGHLYEDFAHLVIPRGGDFRTRNLSTGEEGVFRLDEKIPKPLADVDDLSEVGGNEYGRGRNAFPGLDAVVSNPPALFNMTASHKRQRGMNGAGLEAALYNLPHETFPRPCRYNWVVPADSFGTFERQSASGIRTQELDSVLEQFAMELSISEPVQRHAVVGGAKRKNQIDEQSGTGSGDGDTCSVVLKSGARKGQRCGRPNCPFHRSEKKAKKQKK